jgi:SagB-type dehydrogenase family enzyme
VEAASALRLMLTDQARIEQSEDGIRVSAHGGSVSVRKPASIIAAALDRLASTGATEDALREEALESRGASALFSVMGLLQALDAKGFLERRLVADGRHVASLIPTAPDFTFRAEPLERNARVKLSRFAYLRAEHGSTCAQSPLGRAKVRLTAPGAAAVVTALASGHSIAELETIGSGLGGDSVAALTVLLRSAALLADADDPETPGAASSGTSAADWWEFQDLLFHMASRRGRHNAPYGGTYRHRAVGAPCLVKPRGSGEIIALSRPDPPRPSAGGPPFFEVLERRRSVRMPGEEPLTVEQLGQFLYWTAHYQASRLDPPLEHAFRAAPAGGALQELELYPVVARCRGLDRGVYHYRPSEHELTMVSGWSAPVERLLGEATRTLNQDSSPDVVLQITARCQRVFWKYESMGYALMLKNLGALYATMYLVATAMTLAPCALGGGDSELFSRIAALEPCEEPAIGEFALSAPESAQGE